MAELADAHGSGPCSRKGVEVQVLLSAPVILLHLALSWLFMSSLTHFTTIEDAYYYFFQAKGTSDTTQGTPVKQRHLRTAVLLAWVAIDDAVAAFVLQTGIVWPRDRGRGLFPKLQFIWRELQSTGPDRVEFDRHRDVRNEIAHPTGVAEVALTGEQVDEVLAYCKATLRVMYPHLVVKEEWKGRLAEPA
jgi:hypothetical protein